MIFVVTLTLFALLQLFYFSLICWFDVMPAFLLENDLCDEIIRFELPKSFCRKSLSEVMDYQHLLSKGIGRVLM